MKTLLYVIAGCLGMILLFVLATQNTQNTTQSTFIGADIGGSFSLINHNAEPVTEKTYKDNYNLIYFGFTFCPAICPTELQKMMLAYDSLPQNVQSKISPLFISIDPERDTTSVMKDYVALFHPDLIGLTGTQEQIDTVKKNYRIYAAKVKDETMSEYTVDHSSYIYLLDQDDKLLDVYKMTTTADKMINRLKETIR